MLRFLQGLLVVCLAVLMAAAAWGDLYVIGGGKRYKRTIVVSPVSGDAAASGAALLKAVNSISGSSSTNGYLVKIEPGYYNLGSNSLNIPSYVDIEGSGRIITTIESSSDQAIISLISYSEVRHVKICSYQQQNHFGITVGANNDCKISNVIIEFIAGTCGEDYQATGIYNNGYRLKIKNVDIRIDDYSRTYGITNCGTVIIEDLNIYVDQSCRTVIGIFNQYWASVRSSTIEIVNTTSAGGSTYTTYGIHNNGGTLKVQNTDIYSSNGYYTYGIFNENDGTVSARDILISSYGGANGSWGLFNSGSPQGNNCWINNSQIKAETYALRNDSSTYNVYAGSCLMNTNPSGAGTVKLVHCYTEGYAAKPDQ